MRVANPVQLCMWVVWLQYSSVCYTISIVEQKLIIRKDQLIWLTFLLVCFTSRASAAYA